MLESRKGSEIQILGVRGKNGEQDVATIAMIGRIRWTNLRVRK